MDNSNNKTSISFPPIHRDLLKTTSELTGQTQSEIIRMAVYLYCDDIVNRRIINIPKKN
jgi:predicted DNA-binding protein